MSTPHLDPMIQALVEDAEGDHFMSREHYEDSKQDFEVWLDSQAQVELERHGRSTPLERKLDELKPREEAFRKEVRSHRHMANEVLRGFIRPAGKHAERLAMSWPSEGPMGSDTDFTPEAL